jgi:hypothetical protein
MGVERVNLSPLFRPNEQGFLDLLDPSNDPEFFWQVISGPPCIYFSGYKLLVASGPYLKNTTNYSTAMTFSFTPDAKLINVKITT